MQALTENVFVNVKKGSVTVTADVEIPKGGANSVILAQGGRAGAFSLYSQGRPADVPLQLARHAAVH